MVCENLFAISLGIISVFSCTTCYTCETPTEWLSGNITVQLAARDQLANQAHSGNRWETWPNGVVKYKLHSSLTSLDIDEVQKAFGEYHSKTCIRFTPWQEGDMDFLSIELDNNICGYANVCKIGGKQVVRFGQNCRNKSAIVHQLGHTLCLGHEHQRMDRDSFLRFTGCSTTPNKTGSFSRHIGIYDYGSQMHSQCKSCNGGWPTYDKVSICGADASPGLSVMDADKINDLYKCQGCQRHRWVPAALLSAEDVLNMYNFGAETSEGLPIYACRALHESEVNPGIYDLSRRSCNISIRLNFIEITEQVEILTIPGGILGEDCSQYQIVKWEDAPLNSLVPVGNIQHSNRRFWNWTSHLAYKNNSGENRNLGKVWLQSGSEGFTVAEILSGRSTTTTTDFQLLTCKFDADCILEKDINRLPVTTLKPSTQKWRQTVKADGFHMCFSFWNGTFNFSKD